MYKGIQALGMCSFLIFYRNKQLIDESVVFHCSISWVYHNMHCSKFSIYLSDSNRSDWIAARSKAQISQVVAKPKKATSWLLAQWFLMWMTQEIQFLRTFTEKNQFTSYHTVEKLCAPIVQLSLLNSDRLCLQSHSLTLHLKGAYTSN